MWREPAEKTVNRFMNGRRVAVDGGSETYPPLDGPERKRVIQQSNRPAGHSADGRLHYDQQGRPEGDGHLPPSAHPGRSSPL